MYAANTVNKATLSPERLNALRRHAWVACMGDNSITQPRIKARIVHHCACDQIVQALSPFLYSMRQNHKAGEEPGNEGNTEQRRRDTV